MSEMLELTASRKDWQAFVIPGCPDPLSPARSQTRDLTGADLEVEADRVVDQRVGRDTRRLCGSRDLKAEREVYA